MTAALRSPLRSVGVAAGGWLRRSSYLQRWLVLGAAIGVIAGLGAGSTSCRRCRRRASSWERTSPIGRLADAAAPTVTGRASLDEVVDALPDGQPWLPVLDDKRQVVGIVAISDVVHAIGTR